MSNFKMTDYIDVATRIVEFREKYPDGSLQQVSIDFREFGGASWVIYTAAAYRSPQDERPGQGTAWEPVPGKTNFTRDSELQNAETAAWGRAIVAVLAADTKRGIASAEEVQARRLTPADEARDRLRRAMAAAGVPLQEAVGLFKEQHDGDLRTSDNTEAITALAEGYEQMETSA